MFVENRIGGPQDHSFVQVGLADLERHGRPDDGDLHAVGQARVLPFDAGERQDLRCGLRGSLFDAPLHDGVPQQAVPRGRGIGGSVDYRSAGVRDCQHVEIGLPAAHLGDIAEPDHPPEVFHRPDVRCRDRPVQVGGDDDELNLGGKPFEAVVVDQPRRIDVFADLVLGLVDGGLVDDADAHECGDDARQAGGDEEPKNQAGLEVDGEQPAQCAFDDVHPVFPSPPVFSSRRRASVSPLTKAYIIIGHGRSIRDP
ncbi:MAG: hypothetical protein A4E73_00581 [Syntrophaceae bacterium PtaU1.Bin231]|nr:MAG: hypothetical protein A4E73_00581 [Syntrophaceae bacterium PtaU1.Bin231]